MRRANERAATTRVEKRPPVITWNETSGRTPTAATLVAFFQLASYTVRIAGFAA